MIFMYTRNESQHKVTFYTYDHGKWGPIMTTDEDEAAEIIQGTGAFPMPTKPECSAVDGVPYI